jgi:hypothetical protein
MSLRIMRRALHQHGASLASQLYGQICQTKTNYLSSHLPIAGTSQARLIGFAVLAAGARHCPAALFQAPYQMAEALSLRRLGAPRVFPTALGMPLFPPEFLGVFHDLIAEQTWLS